MLKWQPGTRESKRNLQILKSLVRVKVAHSYYRFACEVKMVQSGKEYQYGFQIQANACARIAIHNSSLLQLDFEELNTKSTSH